jgi:hypothetical protein
LDELPEDIVPLLQSCWVEDPKLRPEFKEITKTLIRILHNIYTTKITALASIKENAEGNSESEAETSRENENILKHDTETIEPNGGNDITQYPTMDEIWFKNVVKSGVQSQSPFQSQSELHSRAQMPYIKCSLKRKA